MKIYVPSDNVFNKCYVVQSEGVIRGYDRVPSSNANYNYRDYYIKSDYIYRDGSGIWNTYSTLPVCLNSSEITNDYWYRVDLWAILVVYFILFIFIVKYPLRLLFRMFGRWLKL